MAYSARFVLIHFYACIFSCTLVDGLKVSEESEASASFRHPHHQKQTFPQTTSVQLHRVSFVSGYGNNLGGKGVFRDNWRSYLQFVPPCVGNYAVSIENAEEFSRASTLFENTTMRGSVAPQLIWRQPGANSHKGLVDKRIWKFFVDDGVDSEVIAFMDDDACFTRTVTHEDIVQDGKVIARGINTPEMLAFDKVKAVVNYLWGREPVAGFMTDFPVTVWRDMLADVRAFVIQHEFPHERLQAMTRQREIDLFTTAIWNMVAAMEKIMRVVQFDEFSLLLHFAYFSPKWRNLYKWNFAPTDINGAISKPIPAFSIHSMFGAIDQQSTATTCPQSNVPAPDRLLMYPANYGMYYDGSSYKNAACKEDGGAYEDCVLLRVMGNESDGNSAIHKYYEQSPAALLQQHARQKSDLVNTCGALSHADQDGTIISKWAAVWPM